MKALHGLFAALLLLVVVLPTWASESSLSLNAKKKLIEDNLFTGLASNNLGLQKSCVLMLGTLQSERAVIPLMSVLHDNDNENLRSAAAWALCKIGDARGIYAVKMAVKFDTSSKVRAVCAWYYNIYVKRGTFIFLQEEQIPISDTNN